MIELAQFIGDFATGLMLADGRRPVAVNARTKVAFQPGIGPHSETEAVRLVMAELSQLRPQQYANHRLGVPYPESPRQKCDLCIGIPPEWEWAIEVKMLRLFGDNGKLNDNMLMHILSPYSEHRSALTDCGKLANSQLRGRRATLIYAYDHDQFPVEPAIRAFELLAQDRVDLAHRVSAPFKDLVHPVHTKGHVFGWELTSRKV